VINSFAGGGSSGKGLGWTLNGQRIDMGAFISAIVYFVVFMAVVYFVSVVPYRRYMQRRGTTVFGAPAPSKTCPSCLSAGLPIAATKCKFCSSDVPSNSRRAREAGSTLSDNFSNAGNAISKRFRSAGLSRSSRELSPMVRSLQSAVSTTRP